MGICGRSYGILNCCRKMRHNGSFQRDHQKAAFFAARNSNVRPRAAWLLSGKKLHRMQSRLTP